MDPLEVKRRHNWIEQIVSNLELEDVEHTLFSDFNNKKLQYLSRRSSELVGELKTGHQDDIDSSKEFKAMKQLKEMKDSIMAELFKQS